MIVSSVSDVQPETWPEFYAAVLRTGFRSSGEWWADAQSLGQALRRMGVPLAEVAREALQVAASVAMEEGLSAEAILTRSSLAHERLLAGYCDDGAVDRAGTPSEPLRGELVEERTLYELAEHLNLCIWIYDLLSQRLLYVSPEYERIFGQSIDDVYKDGFAWMAMVHPDDRPLVERNTALQRMGESTEMDYRIVRPNGEVRWISSRVVSIRNEQGEIYRIAGVVDDITSRKHTEMALRRSEERLHVALDVTTHGVWEWDLRSKEMYLSPQVAKILGYEERGVRATFRGWLEQVAEEDRPRVMHGLRAFLAEAAEAPGHLEYRMRHKSGSLRWIESRLKITERRPDGRAARLVGADSDITEQKRAHEALRDSEALFRMVVENASDMISWTDKDGRWKYVSPASFELMGYHPDELEGESAYRWMHDDDFDAVMQLHGKLLRSPETQVLEHRLHHKNGGHVWVDVHARSVRDPNTGEFREILSVARNINDRKRAEEAEREHQRQLAHVNRVSTLGEMASGLAHELAQPLSAILYYARGASTRLRNSGGSTQAISDALDHIAAQADRAGEFIRRLKAFVRQAQPHIVPTDIREIMRDTLSFAAPETREHSVAIDLSLADDLPLVQVDRIQIEQVLLNIVRNGIEAMQATDRSARRLQIAVAREHDGRVSVTVADCGSGLPEDGAERVFDPFFTTRPAGTGLGLSISRSIIEAHEGEMWAADGPDGGAVFGFVLPVSQGEIT